MKIQTGFTLIELMIVVAIIAILASIAIPAYQGYIKQSKITSLIANHKSAVKVVRAMVPKIAVCGVGNNVITSLMRGAPNAIGGTADAFISGAAVANGQVSITGLTGGCPVAGDQVTVSVQAVEGTVFADYPGGALPLLIFTPE